MYINIIQQPVGNFHIMTLSERCQLYRTENTKWTFSTPKTQLSSSC